MAVDTPCCGIESTEVIIGNVLKEIRLLNNIGFFLHLTKTNFQISPNIYEIIFSQMDFLVNAFPGQ